jgi:endoglucanase
VPSEASVDVPEQPVSPFIVVDQFGYLADSEKIAVLRDPETGFDGDAAYVAGSQYQIIDAVTHTVALELTATPWNAGAVHEQSGDRAWSVDFSAVTTPGVYYVLDVEGAVRSDLFRIAPDVYRTVLHHALRTLYYQRAGFEKTAEFAGEGWADGASHIGPGQDKNARRFDATEDATTERDLSGGWYDAGDYNRYTPWTADYIVALLRMYEETPAVFDDQLGIPESGNGTPDILDEARFGLAHLIRTQAETGGCISVLGVASASPPSAATEASIYGPETTNATLRAGIAFAWAARLFAQADATFAADMLRRAQLAWDFASANPDLEFNNTGQVAAGEQQSTPEEVELYKLGLAVALYRAGGDASLKQYFEDGYALADIQFLNGYNAAWQLQFTELYLDYTRLQDAEPSVKQAILSAFTDTMGSEDNLGMLTAQQDPYLAHVADYTWGSNAHKARTGCLFHDLISYSAEGADLAAARVAAERYVHYLHGVNPLGLVYLSNMGSFGAHNSVTTFYHTWFADESPLWDEVGVSTYGPPPGFLVGGPNPSYDWDGVCPGQASCPAERPTPPYGQPAQKSYAQFNTNWPVNSWAVTENSNGYQVYYLRLLAKFVH